MVGVVVVDAHVQRVEDFADMLFLKAQAQAFAFELGAIHPAPGVAGVPVTLPGGQLQQRVGIRRPADGEVGVPLVPLRGHAITIAIFVIAGFRFIAVQADIALAITKADVGVLIEAIVGGGEEAGIALDARAVKAWWFPVEAHRPGGVAWPPEHGFRPFGHGQQIVAFRRDVRARGIHSGRTRPEHLAVVGQQTQTGAEHAAKHRIAVAAAVTDLTEAGNGFQVIGTIAGRDRLTRRFWRGYDLQRRENRGGHGDHIAIIKLRRCVLLGARGSAGERDQQRPRQRMG